MKIYWISLGQGTRRSLFNNVYARFYFDVFYFYELRMYVYWKWFLLPLSVHVNISNSPPPPPKFIWSLSDSMNFRFALCFLSAFGSKWDCVHIQRKPLMIYGWFNLSGNEYWRDSKFKWKNSRFAISIMKKCLWLICICPYKRKRDERKGRRDGESM